MPYGRIVIWPIASEHLDGTAGRTGCLRQPVVEIAYGVGCPAYIGSVAI